MSDITDVKHGDLPSTPTLLKATGIAIAVAGLILITTILPAEYGIDPTGLGKHLGLSAMKPVSAPAEPQTAASSPVLKSARSAVWKSATPYRSDEMSLTLQPGEGSEIKARMKSGEHLVFSWVAEGGAVNFDMHGEAVNATGDEFTSYWMGQGKTSGHGAFEAPMDGTHGWYWSNPGQRAVTVRVMVSGYFGELFEPS